MIPNEIMELIIYWLNVFKDSKNREPWLDEMFKCFEFAYTNSQMLQESHLHEIYYTLYLLDSAFNKGEEYACLILEGKYSPLVTAEQAGKSFLSLYERLNDGT